MKKFLLGCLLALCISSSAVAQYRYYPRYYRPARPTYPVYAAPAPYYGPVYCPPPAYYYPPPVYYSVPCVPVQPRHSWGVNVGVYVR